MPLNPITGDANFNNLFGTDLADLIKGLGGNDAINGNPGDDRLYGGNGDDYVFGNEDDDRVYGGSGNDVVSGGDGDDLSYGGGGDDDIVAVAGNDTMYGGTGNDDIFGGFTSSGGTQLMFGGDGDDLLRFYIGQSGVADGGAGTDTVSVYWYDTAAYTTAVAITLYLATGCEHAQVCEAAPATPPAPVAEVAPAPVEPDPAPTPGVSATQRAPLVDLGEYRGMSSRMGPRWDREHRPRLKLKPPLAFTTDVVDGGVK